MFAVAPPKTRPTGDAHNVAVLGLGLSCLIIGKISQLGPEICNGDVFATDGRPPQQLLRARRFASPRDKDIRSDVIATAEELPSGLQEAEPAVVIFESRGLQALEGGVAAFSVARHPRPHLAAV